MGQNGADSAASFEAVLRTYADTVYRLAFSQVRSRSDAEDVFQEVFLRYLKRAPSFASEEHRRAWLIRVTLNCAKKLRSSAWFRRTVPLDRELPFEREESLGLYCALQQLPANDRAVLHLFYYEDYSVAEIGALLGRKPATVRSQLSRARQKLKKILKENADVSGTLSPDEC